jgi:hypothetical protein
MVFNSTNLLILLVVLFLCYTFWEIYLRGTTVDAVVDGYEKAPARDEKEKDLYWCVRFMYRTQKGGKRCFCYSKRRFNTQPEAIGLFPRGTELKVRYFKASSSNRAECVILSDSKDRNQALFYTLIAFGAGIALAIGYQLLMKYFM